MTEKHIQPKAAKRYLISTPSDLNNKLPVQFLHRENFCVCIYESARRKRKTTLLSLGGYIYQKRRDLASAEHVLTRSLRPWRPMRSPLPQRKGLTSTEHVRRPAVYVPDASCVRPFRSEYSIAANAKSSVWQNIMSKGQYIGQWISSRRNFIDKFPTAV